ncbi:MAG TPA: arginase [Clostridiales bacterium]|nr:arginase [Clostridiales bacterium]
MEKCLLSIDWDYFIYTKNDNWGSYIENKRSLVDLWYKRYIQEKALGRDIKESYKLSPAWNTFWKRIEKYFIYANDIKAYVSDSHALSYEIAKENSCQIVCLFDSHADLGYGGLPSLNFEVNCSNWLGKLLKDKQIKEANIFYSPYTIEKPEYFKQINSIYNIRYCSFSHLNKSFKVSAVHICRSGAWTPPWLDDKFTQFIDAMGIEYEIADCPARKWDTENISLSHQINYLMA